MKEISLIGLKYFLLTTVVFLALGFQNLQAKEKEYDFSWLDPDKKIYVVQNRKFKKINRFSLGVSLGKTMGKPFNDVLGGQVSATYFFKEQFGIRIFGVFGSSDKSSLYDDTVQASQKPLVRELKNIYGALFQWAPFYGKLNTFQKIVYYDWILGAGIGRLTSTVDKSAFISQATGVNQFGNITDEVDESYTAYIWDVAVRVYLSENLSAQIELFSAHYKAPAIIYQSERWFSDRMILLGVNYIL